MEIITRYSKSSFISLKDISSLIKGGIIYDDIRSKRNYNRLRDF